jgi:predicted Zn-dependent protease
MHSDPTGTTIHRGRFSDGKTAATRTVEVRLGPRGLELHGLGGEGPLVWPYGALTTGSPLGRDAHDVLVGYTHQKGASLFVEDATFAADLSRAAPHLTARATRWRHATPWLWAFAGVFAIAAAIWAMNLSPTLWLARALPDSTRQALGSQVVRAMTQGRKVCEAPAGRAALDVMMARLSAAAGGSKPFKVVVVDWGLVNAFATAGEQLVLTRGLIDKATSADEVAGVLAHEIGHGLELHPETGIIRALGISAAIELMAGGSAGTIANLGAMLAQFSYTRAAEREADAHALRILRAAQISPQGIIDFFARVEKVDSAGGSGLDILRTHPQVAERRKLAEAVPKYPTTPALADAQWQALRKVCGG